MNAPPLPRTVRMNASVKLTMLAVPGLFALIALVILTVSFVNTLEAGRETVAAGPGWSRPWAGFRTGALVVGGAFAAASALVVVLAGARYPRERRLMRWGAVTLGRIEMDGRAWYFYQSRRPGAPVRYSFQAEARSRGGGARTVRAFRGWATFPGSRPLDAAAWRRPIVIYDPKRPSRNMLYPPATVTCEGFSPEKEGIPNDAGNDPPPAWTPRWPDRLPRSRR